MHSFAVWAPRVNSCRVQVSHAAEYPMEQQAHGWWTANAVDAKHGDDYAFLLDDDPKPYPDPRSPWQPNGVHQSSRVLDHSLFPWTDRDWSPPSLSQAVIYELHVGTFTPEGTFEAAIERLPYLRSLGITHVELMPVNSFPGRWGWGYDGAALYAPQEQYGGPQGLKELVDACHATGLAAVLDVVYNHFGPVGNYTGKFGPYLTESHHTPWGGAVNLEEAGSDEVRRFFCDNALMWLRDYHFDGLRLDAVQTFVDRSARHFLEQLSEEVEALSKQLGRGLVLIAESDLNDPHIVIPRVASLEMAAPRTADQQPCECISGGYGMDAQWSDDFHHALFALLTGERHGYYSDFGSLAQLAKSLSSVFVYDGQYSEYRGRTHGRPVQCLSAHSFLGYIQNHDQVGNRPFGDRLHAEAGTQRARLAAALVITAPFLPMIFQGEEFAASSPFLYFADHDDPELARAVSEGRRKEHAQGRPWESIPDPEAQRTFEISRLRWQDVNEPAHAEMLEWYRSLIQLRKSQPSLLDGNLESQQVDFDETQLWLTLQRGQMRMFYNFSEDQITLPLTGHNTLMLASGTDVSINDGAIVLPGLAFATLAET
ncbi:MAG TPA: malto-oligosyltrehalose trehalohydrolase [Acidobacteriaceae bacterium]|nr:malto-oligosyltrehalose trehalohydrolase [Acidobacteriaceae bacterium]